MKFNRILVFGLAIATIVVSPASIFAQKRSAEPIKVFVFTAPNEGGFVDSVQKLRTDSVEDLKKTLDKKDLVELVSQKEGANMTLEVLGRGGEETGSATTSRGAYGTWNTSKDTVATVRVGLTAGTYSTLVEGHSDGRIKTYGAQRRTTQRRRLKTGSRISLIVSQSNDAGGMAAQATC